MPSRNSINLPKSLNPRRLAHRRTVQRRKSVLSTGTSRSSRTSVAAATGVSLRPRETPGAPRVPSSILGVTRAHVKSKKRVKKEARNRVYVKEREGKEEGLMADMVERGEVRMVDASEVPLSKRQQKLAERKAAAEQHNAETKMARAAEARRKAEEMGVEIMEE